MIQPRKTTLLIFALLALMLSMTACNMPKGDQAAPEGEAAQPEGPSQPPANASAGDAWTSPKDSAKLVYVPAGEFLMGSKEFDALADPDEIPMHTVNLSAFWIDQTEVTNAMFLAFLNEKGNQSEGGSLWYEIDSAYTLLSVKGPEWVVEPDYEDHPVYEVSWYGAKAYCEWVGRRLPTEAEWEKAARGTDGRIYPWGMDEPSCGMVNFWTGSKTCAGESAPVGSYPAGASPFNVLDMAGNVWEWVSDWYSEIYYADSPSDDPGGPPGGTYRVIRGGGWESGPRNLRAPDRTMDEPDAKRYRVGFRCALTP